MNEPFLTLLIVGSIKDPMLWILGFATSLIVEGKTYISHQRKENIPKSAQINDIGKAARDTKTTKDTKGSGILFKKYIYLCIYLLIVGVIWGLIRLYIYKALGEILTINQTLLLIFICVLLMLIIGLIFNSLIKLIKSITY